MANFTPSTEIRSFLEAGSLPTARTAIGMGSVDDTSDVNKPISNPTKVITDALEDDIADTNAKIDKTLYSGDAESGLPWTLDLGLDELREGWTVATLAGVAKIAVYGSFSSGTTRKGFYEVTAIWDATGGGDVINLKTGVSDLMDSTGAFTITTSLVSGKLRLVMESSSLKTLYVSIIYSNPNT